MFCPTTTTPGAVVAPMRRPIEPRHRICLEMPSLDEPGAKAGQRGLPDAHRAEGEVGLRHAIHPRLNGCRLEIAEACGPTPSATDELQILPQIPSVGRDDETGAKGFREILLGLGMAMLGLFAWARAMLGIVATRA